ncbi:hypothetical protein ACTXML_09055 [Glutamicibacter arilaitensis]|uniref:hypothetical protein n=1 Tax=Glutamicibacter arilaitensis TaxID=256701 RepID=UPI003FD56FCA
MSQVDTQTWVIHKVAGFNNGHSFFAVAPGCEPKPHPTRWCLCKIHQTMLAAKDYIEAQGGRTK